MRDHLVTLSIQSSVREELVDITPRVEAAVREAGLASGMAWVYSPHTTAGITIQENADPDVQRDLLAHLRQLVPRSASFRHSEGNSDAHIKASLVGPSLTIIVENGDLVLGVWQGVYFAEFDGPRQRKLLVKTQPD